MEDVAVAWGLLGQLAAAFHGAFRGAGLGMGRRRPR